MLLLTRKPEPFFTIEQINSHAPGDLFWLDFPRFDFTVSIHALSRGPWSGRIMYGCLDVRGRSPQTMKRLSNASRETLCLGGLLPVCAFWRKRSSRYLNITLLLPPLDAVCKLNMSGYSCTKIPNFILPKSFLKLGSRFVSSATATLVCMAPPSSKMALSACAYV